MDFKIKPIEEFVFDQEVMDKWMAHYDSHRLTAGDLKNDEGCFCALGSLVQTLADDGWVVWNEWDANYITINAEDGREFVGCYVVLEEFIFKMVHYDPYYLIQQIYRANDNILVSGSEKMSRDSVKEILRSELNFEV